MPRKGRDSAVPLYSLTLWFTLLLQKKGVQGVLSSMFNHKSFLIILETEYTLFQRYLHLSCQRKTEVIFGLKFLSNFCNSDLILTCGSSYEMEIFRPITKRNYKNPKEKFILLLADLYFILNIWQSPLATLFPERKCRQRL